LHDSFGLQDRTDLGRLVALRNRSLSAFGRCAPKQIGHLYLAIKHGEDSALGFNLDEEFGAARSADGMARANLNFARLLTAASEARITCPRGTDLRLDLTGREGIPDDGDLTGERAFGNLPCGEGFTSPLGAEGRMVTGCLASIGLPLGDPPVLTIEDGKLVSASQPEGDRLLAALDAAGGQGRNVAELGIGTNERAELTGNILEDEKILGTVHVAFGASAGIGGTVSVPVHLDCLILEPTLEIGGERVLERGQLLL